MPKITLKPNSPEYMDSQTQTPPERTCDITECTMAGDYKAPKSRGCNDYYYFCLDHIRDYNAAWNFFDGMSPAQVQEEMLRSLYGDRPTWRHEGMESPTEALHRKAWQSYNYSDENEPSSEDKQRRANAFAYHHESEEYKAMALLGLTPPLNLDDLKKRYKELVKKHHPDRNNNDKKAEELLKEINIAYKVLKIAFEAYEKMMNKG